MKVEHDKDNEEKWERKLGSLFRHEIWICQQYSYTHTNMQAHTYTRMHARTKCKDTRIFKHTYT